MIKKAKKALILASSRGLGFACADSLMSIGFIPTINGTSDENLNAAKQKLENKYKKRVMTLKGSISQKKDLNKFLEILETQKFDCLVINSGGPAPGKFLSFSSADDFIKKNDEIIRPAVAIMHLASKIMIKKNWGRIINISSIGLQKPIPDLAVSNASRSYLHGLMVGLASELGPFNVTVNTVCPGIIMTDRQVQLTKHAAKETGIAYDQILEGKRKLTMLGRLGQPNDIGEIVAFLASDAGAYITAQKILVDGGAFGGA